MLGRLIYALATAAVALGIATGLVGGHQVISVSGGEMIIERCSD